MWNLQLLYQPRQILYFFMLILSFPFLLGFSPDLLDQLDIVEVRDMQLRQEGHTYFLDTVIVIRNANKNTLKLEHCTFDLALAFDNGEDISLGTAQIEEILLPHPESVSDEPTDIEVPLAVHLGQNIQALSQQLSTQKEMALLLTQPRPHLNLRLQGRFDLGIKAAQLWGYQSGITIDWIVTPEIRREVLAKVIQTMAAGQAIASATPSSTSETGQKALSAQPPATAQTDASESSPSSEAIPHIVVYFDPGSTSLNSEAIKTLQAWAKQQRTTSSKDILHVEGHTDSSGDAEQNQIISVKRAGAVYYYLTNTLGITWEQTVVKGFGETRLLLEEDGTEIQAKNRRVELYVGYK
jgi:outer membrane protein OmpA-like peptidoglycan-associated protein